MIEALVITGREQRSELAPPLQALSAFYAAFNQRDLAALEANWANTNTVVMANPVGGIRVGWPEIKHVYERIFQSPASVYVEFHDYVILESPTQVLVTGRERGSFRNASTTVELAIRTSRGFSLIDGSWRQVHHHGSIDDPSLLAAYQTAIRAI